MKVSLRKPTRVLLKIFIHSATPTLFNKYLSVYCVSDSFSHAMDTVLQMKGACHVSWIEKINMVECLLARCNVE